MRTKRRALSLALAVLLLSGLLCPAAAAGADFSGDSFTVTDIVTNKTVTFRGNSGKPAVLMFGGIGSCKNTEAYIADLLALLSAATGTQPLVYLIDVGSNPAGTVRSTLGVDPLPENVFVGARETMKGSNLLWKILNAIYGGGGSYSYTMPLAAYLDENGVMQAYSMGAVSRTTVAEALTKIGAAVDTDGFFVDVPFEVQFLQTEARKELAAVNALRTGADAWFWNEDNETKTVRKNLPALTYDYALERVAMQRALELAALYAHVRPDGERCFTAYEEQNYKFLRGGENIAYGYRDAASVETAWEEADEPFEGQGHRRNILGEYFVAFGSACVEYNGVRFWAQEFSDTVNDAKKTAANDTVTEGTVRFDPADLSDWRAEPAAFRTGLGQTQRLSEFVRLYVTFNGRSLQTALRPEWTAADPAVASVSAGDAVTGNAVGETTLTARTPQKGAAVSVSVTVREKGVDNTPITEPVKQIGGYLYCVPGTALQAVTRFLGTGTRYSFRFIDGAWEAALPEAVYTGLRVVAPDGRTYYAVVMGDTDGDGEISAADARIALRIAVGLEPDLPIWHYTACYVDNAWESEVDAGKARLILRGAVGLEDPLEWFRAVTPD